MSLQGRRLNYCPVAARSKVPWHPLAMPWPGDLLRFLYNGVENELLRADGRAQGQAPPPNPPADDDDNDDEDEDALDLEDQMAFLSWEVKLASRSGGIHDFEARDPAVSSAGREKVADQLSFLDDQVTPPPMFHVLHRPTWG